ncbi:hypothetical protein Pcinc_033907 [Petrolisthes cinctipes]|uniref:C2H2-type domain-containing protein n=1 Tax=Petrolisthes cinctipes TaxID=88211 RepID=A0AAE1ERG3_PETCI|nr:hypothetical protein Pcinc_033907 [Petrolisthes cinctipes]
MAEVDIDINDGGRGRSHLLGEETVDSDVSVSLVKENVCPNRSVGIGTMTEEENDVSVGDKERINSAEKGDSNGGKGSGLMGGEDSVNNKGEGSCLMTEENIDNDGRDKGNSNRMMGEESGTDDSDRDEEHCDNDESDMMDAVSKLHQSLFVVEEGGEGGSTPTIDTSVSESQDKKFVCEVCGKAFGSNSKLARHIPRHTGIRNFECEECGKRFLSKCNLNAHTVNHRGVRNFECTECERNYQCPNCDKRFVKESHLRVHMLFHTGVKHFKCDECGKEFFYKTNLSRHKVVHMGIKKYECEECGKKFFRNTELKQHKAVHSGVRNFECEMCGKSYYRKEHLNRHKALHTDKAPRTGPGNPVVAAPDSSEALSGNTETSLQNGITQGTG